ncbi:hypothetical protein N752_04770 [Desulforamulus aquiferis]|nr:S8 family serine peptidase [Desulforamulus aquiferis]RYD06205.1 hypothetical protein N752_04770 [Desulforamulus aquiferis]
MVETKSRERIILFKTRLHRGELTPPHFGLINWMGAQEVRTLPNINGVFCIVPGEVSDTEIMATGGVLAIEENIKIKLLPWLHQKNKLTWWENEQLMPWGVHYIGADVCWQETRGRGVRVAVVDSGIDGDHPDLRNNLKGGINLIKRGTSFQDDNGHGTHIAGIIAAEDSDSGVIGVAPEAWLYSVKVLDEVGNGTILGAIEALQWCLYNRIDVVNMSFGTDKYSRAFEEAVRTAHEHGLLIVAAAGNDGEPGTVDYPAVFDETLCIAAVDSRVDWLVIAAVGRRLICWPRGAALFPLINGALMSV